MMSSSSGSDCSELDYDPDFDFDNAVKELYSYKSETVPVEDLPSDLPPPRPHASRLWEIATAGVSIESANLKFHPGDGTLRHIYGHIRIDGGLASTAFRAYERSADQPETVVSSSDGVDLTLCGLNHFLPHREPDYIYVDIRENNGTTLMKQKIPLVFHDDEGELPSVFLLHCGKRITVKVTSDDGTALITISMFIASPTVLSRIRIKLLSLPNNCSSCSVHGSVKAIQTLGGERKGSLTIFNKLESESEVRAEGQYITLDRSFVLAPVLYTEDMAKRIRDILTKTVNKDSEYYPYLGQKLTLELDLKLKSEAEGAYFYLKEDVEFEIDGRELAGSHYIRNVFAKQNLKRPFHLVDSGNLGVSDDNAQIQIIVTPFNDMITPKDDEKCIEDKRSYPIAVPDKPKGKWTFYVCGGVTIDIP